MEHRICRSCGHSCHCPENTVGSKFESSREASEVDVIKCLDHDTIDGNECTCTECDCSDE